MSGVNSFSQETVSYTDAWFTGVVHVKFAPDWKATNEFHWRYTDFLDTKLQFLIRPSVTYKRNNTVSYALGYTYIKNYPYRATDASITRPEHNIWEQVALSHAEKKLKFNHRFRLENRFIARVGQDNASNLEIDGYNFVNRMRYRLTLQRDFGPKVYARFFDEVMIRLSDNFGHPGYDRNWIYLGVGYKLGSATKLEVAYMHQNIRRTALAFEEHPTLVMSLSYNIDATNREAN